MVASLLGVSAAPSSATDVKRPMAVVARDFQFLGAPPILPAGQYDLRFFNLSRDEAHVFVAVNLGPSCGSSVRTAADGKALLERVDSIAGPDGNPEVVFGDLCPLGSLEGDGAFAEPGGRSRADYSFTPGKTMYFCPIPNDDGTPHYDLGMIGFINVFSLPTGR